jgi:hypothetical protein
MTFEKTLVPLPFHYALRDALRDLEPGQLRWFSSEAYGNKYRDSARLELLRSTYRMPRRDAHDKPYAIIEEVAKAFGIDCPATLYQAQEDGAMNAALLFVPDEVHVILRGPVVETLTELELRALFGHELSHHKLWTEEDGSFRVTGALIEHLASRADSAAAHVQSALRYRKWTEIYADRGSFLACDDIAGAIGCLVKVSTGLREVNADAYLAQAEEAIAGATSLALTHPEPFIRAFALKAWASGTAENDAKVKALVEGARELDALDLVQQRELTKTTRAILDAILAPTFMRTETTLAHAKRFFTEATFGGRSKDSVLEALPANVAWEESIAEYVAYLLLDFGMVDPDIEELAMPHVARLAEVLDVRDVLRKLTKKELRLTAAAYGELERRGAGLAEAPPSEASL